MKDPELPQDYRAAMDRLRHKGAMIVLEFDAHHAICLVTVVQLALRHPRMPGASAKIARRLIDGIIAALGGAEPVIGKVLRMGYDSACDEPRRSGTPDTQRGGGGGSYDPSAGETTPGASG